MAQTGLKRGVQAKNLPASHQFGVVAAQAVSEAGRLDGAQFSSRQPLTQHVKAPRLDGQALRDMVRDGGRPRTESAPVQVAPAAPATPPPPAFAVNPADLVEGSVRRIDGLGDMWVPASMHNDVIMRWLAKGVAWEPYTFEHFRAFVKPGDFVIDAGAFNGCFTLPLSKLVGPEGLVYAFEPQTDIRQQLLKNLTLNDATNVQVFSEAAGNARASSALYVNAANRGASSLHKCADTTAGIFTVEQVPLDSVLPDRPVSFMKIDVSGFDYELIQGARHMLTKYLPPLWIEVWSDDRRRQENLKTSRTDVFALLEAIGYQTPSVNAHTWDFLILPRRLPAL